MEEYLLTLVERFRTDWWSDQKNYVEVWVEKRTLIKKLAGLCLYFNVTLMPCVGWNSETYIEKGAKVYGIDIAEVSIKNLAQRFKDANFKIGDISSKEYQPPCQFDIINMWDVIYHIVDDISFYQTLRNVAKSCKHGGFLLVDDYFGASSDFQTAPQQKEIVFSNIEIQELNYLKAELSKAMWEYVGIIRNETKMDLMLRKLEHLNTRLAAIGGNGVNTRFLYWGCSRH